MNGGVIFMRKEKIKCPRCRHNIVYGYSAYDKEVICPSCKLTVNIDEYRNNIKLKRKGFHQR